MFKIKGKEDHRQTARITPVTALGLYEYLNSDLLLGTAQLIAEIMILMVTYC